MLLQENKSFASVGEGGTWSAPGLGDTLTLDSDGLLSLKDGDLTTWYQQGGPGSFLILKNDGNLILRDPQTIYWSQQVV